MATTIIKGRSITVEIDGDDYSPQITDVQLVPSDNTQVYEVLTGSVSEPGVTTWTLEVNAFQDWGATDSFCEALVTAAIAGSKLPFEMVVNTSTTVTGTVVAIFPPMGGAAPDALEMDLTFQLDGEPSFAFA
jgi:hypothetical protein